MNAHDILREEKKKRQTARVVSEEEVEGLEAAPLTTESFFDEFRPVESVVVDFPDGSERLVKVRRFNNAEAFSGIGVFTIIQEDGTIDEDGMSRDEKVALSVQIKRRTVVVGMADPVFKLSDSEGPGYPVEYLGGVYLNLFFEAVQAVNNPQEVQAFLRNFREADSDRAGSSVNVDVGEEGGTVSAETESVDTASGTGESVSVVSDGDR